MSAILRQLGWVQPGATILHRATGSKYTVGPEDGAGWWLTRQFDGSSERYTRADVLLLFEPVKTRFQRVTRQ